MRVKSTFYTFGGFDSGKKSVLLEEIVERVGSKASKVKSTFYTFGGFDS